MLSYVKINESLRKKYIDEGLWTTKTILDYWRESVKKYTNNEYVVDDRGNRYTYKQVDEKADKIAEYLKEIGIKEGEVVSFQIPVWSEFVLIAIACLKVGAVLHPLAMFYEGVDLIKAMNKTASRVYFGLDTFRNRDYKNQILSVKKDIKSLEHIVILENFSSTDEVDNFYEILERECEKEIEKPNNSGFDITLILSTSGTTGGNKGVLLTHNNILFSELGFNKDFLIDEKDSMFMASPLNHATGFHHGVIATMLAGAKVVLQQRFDVCKAIEIIEEEKCTYSMGATPFIYDILKCLKEKDKKELQSLRLYLCGGAPVPKYLIEDAIDYGIRLCEVYGSTESVPHVYIRYDEARKMGGISSGRAMGNIEVKVVDSLGKEVQAGKIGEELSRGPNVFVGYLDDKNSTDMYLDDDGWFHSGDLCTKDELGNIKILGRKKDIIVRGGENLDSNEINDYIEGFSGVKDHAVVGMPDDRLGERICAYLVLTKGNKDCKLEDIIGYFKAKNIPKRFWPERIEIVESIPKTHSGKVKKFILQEDIKKKLEKERN